MYTYICTYIYIYIYIHTYTYVCMYIILCYIISYHIISYYIVLSLSLYTYIHIYIYIYPSARCGGAARARGGDPDRGVCPRPLRKSRGHCRAREVFVIQIPTRCMLVSSSSYRHGAFSAVLCWALRICASAADYHCIAIIDIMIIIIIISSSSSN